MRVDIAAAMAVAGGGDIGETASGCGRLCCCGVWITFTAAPFHTVPLKGPADLIFARSSCIGSALVPFRKSGGKSNSDAGLFPLPCMG
jgi:hypothetical protein